MHICKTMKGTAEKLNNNKAGNLEKSKSNKKMEHSSLCLFNQIITAAATAFTEKIKKKY